MASSDELAGAARPSPPSSSSGVPLDVEERSMSTINAGRREELRGLGEELVRLDIRVHSSRAPRRRSYHTRWLDVVSDIVAVVDPDLHDALHPYNDRALIESRGEQLLDVVIRLASEQQWKRWQVHSMKLAASTCATDLFLRLLTSSEDCVDDKTLSRLLTAAAEGGSVEILSALVAAGAGPLVRAVDEETWPFSALHRAARRGHRTFAAKLIEAGAPVDLRHFKGGTALTEAAQRGHKGVALQLLAAGADVNKTRNPTFHHTRPDGIARGNCTPLCIAVQVNDEEMVKVLLEAGADPSKGPMADYALLMAARQGQFEILNSLLLAGANVSSVDTTGRSALHLACAHNQHDAVALLLRHNSSVATLCNSGISPMDVVGVEVLALRQSPIRREFVLFSYPSTLNSAETSTVDKICGMLESASAWGRRGWLVMMRSRPLAEVFEQPHHSDADEITLSVRDMNLVQEPSSNTGGLREEGGTARTLRDGGYAVADWRAAVVWLLQGPDESLFCNIMRFL